MSARDYALVELDCRRLPSWPAYLISRKIAARVEVPSDPRDRALAGQLIIGVTKNQIHLRWLTSHLAQRALRSIDPLAQKIIAIGLYQLRFLSRIPPSAAVNEAVEQARRFGRARAAGFINAVLRKAASGETPPLPDRQSNPPEYARIVLSHPPELYQRLSRLMLAEDVLRFCEHDNREPPTIVRTFRSATAADLQHPGISITPHEQSGLYVVEPAPAPLLADWSARGIAQAQDPTAAAVVPHLAVAPGLSGLDRCAGLGTKTLQMWEATGPAGHVLAMDPSADRCRTLRNLLEQRGIDNVAVRRTGVLASIQDLRPPAFDRILMDVPCSNSGVLARRAEARYAQTAPAIASLVRLQDRILDDAADWLRPDGRAVYSTCSIWPQENDLRIAAFLTRRPDYRLLEQQTTLPSFASDPTRYHDGGYFAVLERRAH